MELTKREIQQMLREMNVKMSVDESYESLKIRLQKENNDRWLKSISRNSKDTRATVKRVIIRKKTTAQPLPDVDGDKPRADAQEEAFDPLSERRKTNIQREQELKQDLNIDERPAVFVKDKITGHDPEKIFSRTKNVMASIMKRADNACELCHVKSGFSMENGEIAKLALHYIIPLSTGGEHSIKNAVALCENCLETINTKKSASDIKKLKRKAREKIYSSVKVVRKVKLKTLRGVRRR